MLGSHHSRPAHALLTGETITVAGGEPQGFADGTGGDSAFKTLYGIAAASDGTLHVADPSNFRIRKVIAGTGEVTTFAGSSRGCTEGAIASALFEEPRGLALSGDGKILFVIEKKPKPRPQDRSSHGGCGPCGRRSGWLRRLFARLCRRNWDQRYV